MNKAKVRFLHGRERNSRGRTKNLSPPERVSGNDSEPERRLSKGTWLLHRRRSKFTRNCDVPGHITRNGPIPVQLNIDATPGKNIGTWQFLRHLDTLLRKRTPAHRSGTDYCQRARCSKMRKTETASANRRGATFGCCLGGRYF